MLTGWVRQLRQRPSSLVATTSRHSYYYYATNGSWHRYNCRSHRFLGVLGGSPLPIRRQQRSKSTTTSTSDSDRTPWVIPGPQISLGTGQLAQHTHASVVGHGGSTVVLSTVACDDNNSITNNNFSSDASVPFLTVEFRQRFHAVGQIPLTNRQRKDHAALSIPEVLASRALDRALRPLLVSAATTNNDDEKNNENASTQSKSNNLNRGPPRLHVSCSVQSYQTTSMDHANLSNAVKDDENTNYTNQNWAPSPAAHPLALAITTASAALHQHLSEPVAAVSLGCYRRQSDEQQKLQVRMDPWPGGPTVVHIIDQNENNNSSNNNEDNDEGNSDDSDSNIDDDLIDNVTDDDDDPWQLVGELLYAGTRNHTCMLEWTSVDSDLPEDQLVQLLEVAHQQIQPLLDQQELLVATDNDDDAMKQDDVDDEQLLAELGLVKPSNQEGADVGIQKHSCDDEDDDDRIDSLVLTIQEQLGNTPAILFGATDSDEEEKNTSNAEALIHHSEKPLLSKQRRGRREQLVRQEIQRLVEQERQRSASTEGAVTLDDIDRLSEAVTKKILQKGFVAAAFQGARADGRGQNNNGWRTIRPIQVQAPALPETVHGSARFARGETQVLCTTTLGPPAEGQPILDPYTPSDRLQLSGADNLSNSAYASLPVGSLRFLRTQENLISDLNSRKSKADKEQTGDSGSLAEVKRAFLQYDFPAYSTGTIPVGSAAHNRRAIGHGALAERAIVPILPDAHDFPYSIRMTSEVTDSNGSSSMATVCGVLLSLLDASVPVRDVVAGVSVGLVLHLDQASQDYQLLLDITGTEDYYGAMDFKIAGTRTGVTALQLDVKELFDRQILVEALTLARNGRVALLEEMEAQQSEQSPGSPGRRGLQPRSHPKPSAPRVEVVRFDPQRKRDLVGPGGIILRQLEDRYGVSVDLTQEGTCLLFGHNPEGVQQAHATVLDLVADVEPGQVYEGLIIEIKDFGAIVELLRNKEGLLHVSELTDATEAADHPGGLAGFVAETLKVGQKVQVVCLEVDPVHGSIKLSRKALLERERENRSAFHR